jgi:hypothetical protein
MNKFLSPDQKIESFDGSMVGTPTGSEHACSMDGCRGARISTRWPDGRISFPCSRGLVAGSNGNLRIG